MPDIHLKYGGSTMARDVNCFANRIGSELFVELKQSNPAADHGSCLHECMESLLTTEGSAPEDFLNIRYDEWDHTVDGDDVELLTIALAAFDNLCNEFEIEEWKVEAFVQLQKDLIGGSADVIAWGPKDVLIIDWKFGYVPVSAEKSWQGATYALSAGEEKYYAKVFAGKTIHCVIIQPKVSAEPSIYAYTPEELDDMYNEILDAVDVHEAGGGEATPGSWCAYCPRAPVCPAKIVEARAAIAVPAEMTMDLAVALGLAEQLEPWIKEVKNFAHAMLEAGADLPGYKLVQKRSTRQWEDPERVLEKLRPMRRLKMEDYSNISLLSAPQLEKVCKAKKIDFEKEFGKYVVKRSSGTTLAPESDKRDAVVPDQISQGDVTSALKKIA